MALATIPMSGCESLPKSARIKPDYSAAFLNCVADEMEALNYGQCTSDAITDWLVMIE
jgi:hypothetical protein